MYNLKPGVKSDPQRRWALPDRIFFGHGACVILAGVYLWNRPLSGFYAEKITPHHDMAGNHIFVTDGETAFDYHGYSQRRRLIAHHVKGYAARHPGWDCAIELIDYDLLRTEALNARQMRGPDQYLHDPIPRAERFLATFDHGRARYARRKTEAHP